MPKTPLQHIVYILSIILLLSFTSCGSGDDRISEGIIEYNITYPYFKDDFMKGFLPKKMSLEFKNGIYKNTIGASLFTSTLISNCKDSTLLMTFDLGKKQYYTLLNAGLTDTMIQKNGIPDIVKLNAADSVAGELCQKYMGVFDKLKDGYDVEVLETNNINLPNSNWCNPYRELDGVLLGYEVDQFGLQMRFRAESIKDTIVNDTIFNVPQSFKKVTLERMLYEVDQLFQSL